MAGILSKDVKLSSKAGAASQYAELTLLMEVPEMGGTPEKVDVTTLADASRKYIDGVKDYGDLAFKFLYENTEGSVSCGDMKRRGPWRITRWSCRTGPGSRFPGRCPPKSTAPPSTRP